MLADAMTKTWERSFGELLLAFVTEGKVRLTYCEESWKRELQKRRAGELRIIELPADTNAPEDASSTAHEFQTLAKM